MKKLRFVLTKVLGMAALLGVGFVAGIGLSWLIGPMESEGSVLLRVLGIAAAAMAAALVQIVAHEAGHMVCGLATGYRFCSFRVGSWMLQREGGRLGLRRMTLAGTGGQCLLAPPELKEGRMPWVLYNLGGVLANLLLSAAAAALLPLPLPWVLRCLLGMILGIGLVFAVTNGVPMQLGGVDNDGANLRSLHRDPGAQRALWVQLKIVEAQSRGLRLREMPEEWFALQPGAECGSGLGAAVAVLAANRLLDQHRLDQAAEWMDRLLEPDTAVEGIQRRMLWCDRVYCALLGDQSPEILAQWETPEQKQFCRQMRSCPSVLRTQYAYALLARGNEPGARAWAEEFDRAVRSWPYPGDVTSERELMDLVRCCWRTD